MLPTLEMEENYMKRTVKLLSLLLLFSCFTYLSLEANVLELHHSQGQAEMPFLLILENGDILVVFNEGHHFNSDAELLYKRYSQITGKWSTAKRAVKKTSSSSFAQLAMDSTGKVHMVCMDGNSSPHRDIYYANYDVDKDKWSNKTLAYDSAGVNSSWPRLRIEDDIMYIVWTHNYNPSIGFTDVVMVTNEVGGSWPVPKTERKTVSNMAQSASVHNFFQVKDKNIYCAWVDDNHKPGNWNVYYTEGMYNKSQDDWNWAKASQLFPGVNQYAPALALDEMGDVHLIFSNKNGPTWYAQKTGSKWSARKSISTGGASFFVILYMKYSHGLLHTVWRQTASNGEGLFYGRALPDGTWAEPVMIADGQIFPGYPVLDVDANGDVHVAWSDGDPDHPRHIYYTKVELPGEPPSAVLNASVTGGLVPVTVDFSAAQSSDPDGKINDYRWNFGDGSSASGKHVTHTFNEEGTFLVRLSVIDNNLRVGTDEVEIVVSTGKPIANISVSATMGMIPLTVLFDGSSSSDFDGNIVSYNWNYGDGTSGIGEIATHIYETGGDFTATLKVTDNDGKIGDCEIRFKIKGLDRALEVMSHLDNVHKVVISFSPNPDQYQKLFASYGVEFISNWPYEHLPHLIKEADIFMQTSRYEGFGLTLIEAMASSLACVSFPAGVATKVIKNGENGFLVSNTNEMIEKIDHLTQSKKERDKMGKKANSSVKKKYHINTMTKKYLDLFKKMKKEK